MFVFKSFRNITPALLVPYTLVTNRHTGPHLMIWKIRSQMRRHSILIIFGNRLGPKVSLYTQLCTIREPCQGPSVISELFTFHNNKNV